MRQNSARWTLRTPQGVRGCILLFFPRLSMVCLCVSVGCGSVHPPPPRPSSSFPGHSETISAVTLPVVSLRVLATGTGTDDTPMLSLDPSGSLSVNNHPWGRLTGTRILDAHGTEVLNVSANGELVSAGRSLGRLTPDGDLVSPRGTVHLGDDGIPEIIHPVSGRRSPGPMRIEGLTASARTTATVLVTLVMLLAHPPTP